MGTEKNEPGTADLRRIHLLIAGKADPRIILAFLFLLVACTIVLRITVEATGYTTPDSHFYLQTAENLVAGKGLVAPLGYPFDASTPEGHLAKWPAGYPVLIAATSTLTGLPVFWASKVTNLLFLGLIFLVLFREFGSHAWLPALYFCSYGMLEVFSYTWSEGPFLFFMLLLIWTVAREKNKEDSMLFLKVFLCLAALFLLRYAGAAVFLFVGLLMVIEFLFGNRKTGLQYAAALLCGSFLVMAYFYMNIKMTGHISRYPRFEYEPANWVELSLHLLSGIFNEFSIARNYFFFKDYRDWLYVALLVIQLIALGIVWSKRKYMNTPLLRSDRFSKYLVIAGMVYLVFIFVVRRYTYFDDFNYRILAPFSMPVWIAILGTVTRPSQRAFLDKTRYWIAGVFLLSLLMNLPKQYLLEKLPGW